MEKTVVIGSTNTRKNSVQKVCLRGKQEIRVLSETPGPVEHNVKVKIKRSKKMDNATYMDPYVWGGKAHGDFTGDRAFLRNLPFSINLETALIPTRFVMKAGESQTEPFRLALQPFMTPLYHPINIYHYEPKIAPSGGTSYFKSLGIEKVKDDGENLMFIQEMKSGRVAVNDGPVNIDDLDDQKVKQIVGEILGKPAKYASKTAYKASRDLDILKDFAKGGKFYIKTIKGKQHVVFKGYAGLRKHYTATHYQVNNPLVVKLTAAGRIKGALKGNFITMIISGSFDIVEWSLKKENEREVGDLLGTLGMTALKTVITSLIVAGLAAAVLAYCVAQAIALPVFLFVGGAILAGAVIGYYVDLIAEKSGATKYAQLQACKGVKFLEKNQTWQHYVAKPLGELYYLLEESLSKIDPSAIILHY